MTSIERTAYPQLKRLTSTRVLHVFFTSVSGVSDSLFADPAAAFCGDASARLGEHPALVRQLNLAPGLVLAAIWTWQRP